MVRQPVQFLPCQSCSRSLSSQSSPCLGRGFSFFPQLLPLIPRGILPHTLCKRRPPCSATGSSYFRDHMYVAALVPAPCPGSLVELFAQTSGPESSTLSDPLASVCMMCADVRAPRARGRKVALRSCPWSEWRDNRRNGSLSG